MRALKDPNAFLFDHLLTLKPVKFLEGELIHDVSSFVLWCDSVLSAVLHNKAEVPLCLEFMQQRSYPLLGKDWY